jgi:hypothetical protein
VSIAGIGIGSAGKQVAHDLGITSPHRIFPTSIHAHALQENRSLIRLAVRLGADSQGGKRIGRDEKPPLHEMNPAVLLR